MLPPSVETDAPETLMGLAFAASLVVVGHDDLVGIIWVTPGECRRLVNVGRSLGAGDQVHIRAAIRQR